MTYMEILKQIAGKKQKVKRFMKFSAPKKKKFGKGSFACANCGRHDGVIRKYGIMYCRQCFRENAESLGWRK